MDPIAAFRPMMSPEVRAMPQFDSASIAGGGAGAGLGSGVPVPPSFNEIAPAVPSPLTPTTNPAAAPPKINGQGVASFESLLRGFVSEVADKQAASRDAVQGLLGGKNVSLHQTMIAMEEAQVSFQLMVEVRNKLLEAYQELMRMQV